MHARPSKAPTPAPSVRDVARAVGLSPATVSRALNNNTRISRQTRERVLTAASGIGYAPRVGRRDRTNVALLYAGSMSAHAGLPFDVGLVRGITAALGETSLDLVMLEAQRSRAPGERYAQMLARKGVQGVILRVSDGHRQVARDVAVEGVPAVVVADRFEDVPAMSWVGSASRETSREAVEHLIALGHTRIAILLAASEIADMRDRLAGYLDAHARAGLAADPRLQIPIPSPATVDAMASTLGRLLAMPRRATAVFAADPFTSSSLQAECEREGLRVPEDLSILGFDDADFRVWALPRMTVVCQDAAAVGRRAVQALRRLIDDPGAAPVRELLPTWLEVRDSTGPAPGTDEHATMTVSARPAAAPPSGGRPVTRRGNARGGRKSMDLGR